MTTLLIADDHPLYRDALKGALSLSFPGLCIREASDLGQTVVALEREDIDLLLLDLNMPGSQELGGLLHIRKLHPQLPVAVISGVNESDVINDIIALGALGFIPKTASSTEIGEAIRTILDGDVWLPNTTPSYSTEAMEREFEDLMEKVSRLTPSQYKVLCFMRDGLLNKQIGFHLNIAEATVKAHITAIFKKLGINNRTQAVLIASQLSLKPPASNS